MGSRLAYGGFTSALMKSMGIDPTKTTPAKMAFKGTKKKINVKSSAAALQALREEVSGAGEATDEGGGGGGGGH